MKGISFGRRVKLALTEFKKSEESKVSQTTVGDLAVLLEGALTEE